MYPLTYVFCRTRHRISGSSDYLGTRHNSPEPASHQALGSCDRSLLILCLSGALTAVAHHETITDMPYVLARSTWNGGAVVWMPRPQGPDRGRVTEVRLLSDSTQLDSHRVRFVYAFPLHHIRVPPGKTPSMLQHDDERKDVMIEVSTQATRGITAQFKLISHFVPNSASPLDALDRAHDPTSPG
jgi:hypothetical protein